MLKRLVSLPDGDDDTFSTTTTTAATATFNTNTNTATTTTNSTSVDASGSVNDVASYLPQYAMASGDGDDQRTSYEEEKEEELGRRRKEEVGRHRKEVEENMALNKHILVEDEVVEDKQVKLSLHFFFLS